MERVERFGESGEPESSIRALFRLADELAEARGERPQQTLFSHFEEASLERPIEVVPPQPEKPVQKPGSPGRVKASNRVMASESPSDGANLTRYGVILLVGLAAGVGLGWQARSVYRPAPEVSSYRPATPEEAHRLLSRKGIEPARLDTHLKLPPARIPEDFETESSSVQQQRVSASKRSSSVPSPEGFDDSLSRRPKSIPPLPVAMPGALTGTLPDASTGSTPFVAEAHPDLHGLEAKVRTAIMDVGGHVRRVSDYDGGRSLVVSIKSELVQALRSRVAHVSGGMASVAASSDDSDAPTDSVQSAELNSAVEAASALKIQLDKDEVAFLPQAPALKSIQAEYTAALQKVAELKKVAHPNTTLEVSLRAN